MGNMIRNKRKESISSLPCLAMGELEIIVKTIFIVPQNYIAR